MGVTADHLKELVLLRVQHVIVDPPSIHLPETKLGMLPAAGGTQSLTRLVGPDAACPVVLTGRNLDIEEALELGIVTEATGPAELDRTAERRAAQLALLDPDIAMKLRRCIAASKDLPLPLGLQFERRLALMD